jgi:hypothetical protein
LASPVSQHWQSLSRIIEACWWAKVSGGNLNRYQRSKSSNEFNEQRARARAPRREKRRRDASFVHTRLRPSFPRRQRPRCAGPDRGWTARP